jgi:hypothetical protein
MNEKHEALADKPAKKGISSEKGEGIEAIKVFLDFTSKAFYPAIAILLIFLLKPVFSEVDFKSLIERMGSAKLGDYEFTFQQAEDVGATTAPLNNKIAELERSFSTLQSDFLALQKASGFNAVDEQTKKTREDEEKRFQDNSQYTVLVFHRSNVRSRAKRITDALLSVGYKSSSTETDFSELKKTHRAGTIYISHSSDGKDVYGNVEQIVSSLKLGGNLKVQQSTTNLRHGEVQILVF